MIRLSKKRLTINSLAQDEADFAANLVDSKGKQWENLGEGYIANTKRIRTSHHTYYYQQKINKKRIMIHGTHGFLSNDIGNLSRPNYHVSTSYVIARDGTVYEIFDPRYWSYHVGSPEKKGTWSNKTISSTTIGIELCNWLWLEEHPTKPDILLDAWGFPYCMKDDKEYYAKSKYRGHDYYATFTDAQYKSLDSLLLRLCRKFDITHSFLKGEDKFKLFYDVPQAGIVSHVNFRSKKVDVGPVFDYSRIRGR